MTGLQSLETIWLSHNEFSVFPSTLLDVPNLLGITIDNNKITALPAQIHRLQKLEYLNVRNNKLTSLPEQITQLPLTELNISGNAIADLSLLQYMYVLDKVNISNNETITTFPSLPASLNEVRIDRSLDVPREVWCAAFQQRDKVQNEIRTLRKVTSLSDLSGYLQTEKLTTEEYTSLAKHNPLLFIQLLEESRRYNAADAQTREDEYFYFSV